MKITITSIKQAFLFLLFLALGLVFLVGYQVARENRNNFYDDAVITKAKIDSVEGTILKGRKIKETYYNYWIVFDSYKLHYQWPEKHRAGETFRAVYDPDKPSFMKPLSRVSSNKRNEWKVFLGFGVIVPIIFFWLSFINYRNFKSHNKYNSKGI